MKGNISYIKQKRLHQAVNMFFFYGIDSILLPASSGQSMNCSFSHFRVGFTRESGRLPLDFDIINKWLNEINAKRPV